MDALILLVEDNAALAQFTANRLRGQGATVEVAATLAEGDALAQKHQFDLALLDLHLPDGLSTTLLAHLRQRDPELAAIMLTERGSIRSAVEAMQLGAVDYLEKPYQQEDLDLAIERALTLDGLRREVRQLRRAAGEGHAAERGVSPAMQAIWHLVATVAPTDANVLITGESGTGKEVVAQAIHAASQRAKGPFIPVNCGAIPETLVEDALFGHEANAFTDARTLRRGDFELADRGTIFLDEIGEMPVAMQPNLLRVLDSRRFFRIGGEREIRADVRVVAATNRPLEDAVAQGVFRQDLLFRLNVITLHLPPLRERREDIPRLIAYFLRDLGRSLNKPRRRVSQSTLHLLVAYAWPGNVRQLRNVLERALILSQANDILPEHLPPEITGQRDLNLDAPDMEALLNRWLDAAPMEGLTLAEGEAHLERLLVRRALRQAGGLRAEAATLLGLSTDSLGYYITKHGLQQEVKRGRA
jgi:DNA-binding NtrC family response regulator